MPKHSFSSDSLAPASLELCAADYSAARMLTDVSDSPSDHIAAPSNTTSLSRNCPGNAERAGKPPRLGSHPGVENKNERVVRNISTATALPIVHAFRDQGRRAISIAMEISTIPNPAANRRPDQTRAIHPTNDLSATHPSILTSPLPSP